MHAPPIEPSLLRVAPDGSVTLIGGFSPTSGLRHFPRATVCPYSGATDVVAVDLPRHGRLWLWTEVLSAPPGYSGPLPYAMGVVVLDGEPELRVISRLLGGPFTLGAPMELIGEEVPDHSGGRCTVWAFRVAHDTETAEGPSGA